jgi:hypothetical protein
MTRFAPVIRLGIASRPPERFSRSPALTQEVP